MDELFYRIVVLFGFYILLEKFINYFMDLDGIYGVGDDGIFSVGFEV